MDSGDMPGSGEDVQNSGGWGSGGRSEPHSARGKEGIEPEGSGRLGSTAHRPARLREWLAREERKERRRKEGKRDHT